MQRFVFTITTGRSGTVYLSDLLRANLAQAEVHHERTGYQDFGVETPDASHFMLFNSAGNTDKVQAFWEQKLARIAKLDAPIYVETSHFLVKAGLIENIAPLTEAGRVDLIVLTRDIEATLWSFMNRFDFANFGFTWLFYLDPRYPRKIVSYDAMQKHGMAGSALWYILEMRARAAYYEQLFAADRIRFHKVDLSEIIEAEGAARLLASLGAETATDQIAIPRPANESKQTFFSEETRTQLKRLVGGIRFDADQLARNFIARGKRLG